MNEQHSLHLQYHGNGCPLLRVCVHSVYVCSLLTAVCVHLNGLNAEHQFRVLFTILDNTSLIFFIFFMVGYLLPSEQVIGAFTRSSDGLISIRVVLLSQNVKTTWTLVLCTTKMCWICIITAFRLAFTRISL